VQLFAEVCHTSLPYDFLSNPALYKKCAKKNGQHTAPGIKPNAYELPKALSADE